MPPISLSVLLHALGVAARARAGETYVALLQRAPRPVVATLAQISSLAGWVLFLEACAPRRRARHAGVSGVHTVPPAAIALLALLSACAPTTYEDALNVHVGQGDVAAERAPAPALERAAPHVELAPEAPAPDPIFALPAARCVGPWADNSDVSTRYVAHPDTGLCAWRCSEAHAELCAELGGVRAPASDGRTYCGGAS